MKNQKKPTIRILSRKSDLAVIQAKIVGNKIINKFPDLKIEYISKKTAGDIDLKTPLSEMSTVGVFTDDLRKDLISKKCDLIVHSWKDLPLDLGADTIIAGSLERADQRDILFVRKDRINLIKKNKTISIFSSAPRRIYNLKPFIKKYLPFSFEKVIFKNIRGNIPTRFQKFLDGEIDGFIVAKAAIDRLLYNNLKEFEHLSNKMKQNINKCIWTIIPLSQNPTSPGQGALGIEIRKNNNQLEKIIKIISDPLVLHCVNEERKILAMYGGGCHQKIGISFFPTFFGLMKSAKGETEEGLKFYEWRCIQRQKNKLKKIKKELLFPSKLKNYNFFKRQEIKESIEKVNNISNHCIWISRNSALPNKVTINSSNIVWTSGIKTWESLAKRGVWINGTSDGMGEDFNPNINYLAPFTWIKLTHNRSPSSLIKNTIFTYELKELPIKENLNKINFFYWMSSSAFHYAVRQNPNILYKHHSCGPGNTYKEIKKMIKNSDQLEIYLSYSEWKTNLINGI